MGSESFVAGKVNFGTPTSPNPDAAATPLGLAGRRAVGEVELQVLDTLSKIQRQQQTDVETLLNVIDARTNQITNRLNKLENRVTGASTGYIPSGVTLAGVPELVEEEAPVVPTIHPSLTNFNLENVVRKTLFTRLHFNNKKNPRGTVELQPDELRWGVREGLEKVKDDGKKLEIIEGYVKTFLKKRKFATTKSFRKQYPEADFKAMGPFFSNATRGLNKLIDKGIV